MIGNLILVLSLGGLDAEANALIKDSYQPGTWSNLATQLTSYYNFCDLYGLRDLPATDLQLERYVTYLYVVKKLSPRSIPNYVSAVRTLHHLSGLTITTSNAYPLKRILVGMCNRNKLPARQAVAVTPDMIKKLVQVVDLQDPVEMVAWVAFLMGFHCLLRSSNLTSRTKHAFDPRRNLIRKDFRMHKQIMLVHIRWSKTLQY